MTVDQSTSRTLPVWTSWSPDLTRLEQWHERPHVGQLVEGGALTLDYRGLRKCWRVYGWRLVDEFDLLASIKVPPNPVFGALAGASAP